MTEFYQAMKRTSAECHTRGFTCWSQCEPMFFCQLQAKTAGRLNFFLRSWNGLWRSRPLWEPATMPSRSRFWQHR